MTSTSSINYKDPYFDHLVLTAILGEPTYETLHHLKNELKTNARSVPTTLGGRNHGYLGMILTPAEYHCIAPTDPFTWPPNLGVFVPNPAGTAAQTESAENTHRLKYIYIFRDPTDQTKLHPKHHRGHQHQISRRPSQPHHRKNYATRPNHPWVPSQQLWTHYPATNWQQDNHRQVNDIRSGPTNWHHLQHHQQPGWIHKNG